MKKITFLLTFLIATLGYSQDLLQDFESGGLGAPFGNLGSATIVSDPAPGGTNGMVAELITSVAGEVWQGVNIDIDQDVQLTTDKTMTIDVYSTSAISILVKVTGSGDGGPDSSTSINHTGSGWETLTATFNTGQDGTGTANGTYTNFVVYPNWDTGTNTYIAPPIIRTVYVDNIKGIGVAVDTCANGMQDGDETGVDCGGSCPTACPSPPTTAAPTPPARPSADVVSLYSGAYTDVSSNFDAGWCGSGSVSEIMVAGDAIQAYLGNACQGIVLDAGIDITTFTHLHVDVFIEAGTDLTSSVFNLKPVQQPGGAALEINLNVASTPALTAGSWLSLDIPVDLSIFTGFKEFGITSNLNNKVWYDNLYIHKNTTLSTDSFDLVQVSAYPNPSNAEWNIRTSNTNITSIEVFNLLGKKVLSQRANDTNVAISTNGLSSGIYIAKVQTELGTKSIKLIRE